MIQRQNRNDSTGLEGQCW